MNSSNLQSFAYSATSSDGRETSGAIDAENETDARQRLIAMGLVVSVISSSPRRRIVRRLGTEDFLTFNQQLAQLTATGLPVEQGLSLLAQEMRRGGLKKTIELVSADMEKGKSLPEAIELHRGQFPPLYGKLIEAGIRAGNVSGVLLDLGEHTVLFRRLQAAIWKTLTYPLLVFLTFLGILMFVMIKLFPNFTDLYAGFHTQLPEITQIVDDFAWFLSRPATMGCAGILAAVLILAWIWARLFGWNSGAWERFVIPLPVVGGVVSRSLVARWCDTTGLAVDAGLDLPSAIELADEAINSPGLRADGAAIAGAVYNAQPFRTLPRGRILTPTVFTAIELSSQRGDLARTLRMLGQMYRQRAESRLAALPAVVSPFLLVFMGLLAGLLMIAILAPIIVLISFISGP